MPLLHSFAVTILSLATTDSIFAKVLPDSQTEPIADTPSSFTPTTHLDAESPSREKRAKGDEVLASTGEHENTQCPPTFIIATLLFRARHGSGPEG